MDTEDEGLPAPSLAFRLFLQTNPTEPMEPSVVMRVAQEHTAQVYELPFPQAVTLWRDLGQMIGTFLNPFPRRARRLR